MNFTDYIIPGVIAAVLVHGLLKGVNVFDCFLEGVKDGMRTAVGIMPALIGLLTCVGMFKACGALDVLSWALSPAANLLHIPREVIPLAILRPVSGSGAIAILSDILHTYGPDSYIGRVASVLEGSSETTFYTIAVYYGAIGITKTRHTLPSSLTADFTGFIMSALMVRLVFGM